MVDITDLFPTIRPAPPVRFDEGNGWGWRINRHDYQGLRAFERETVVIRPRTRSYGHWSTELNAWYRSGIEMLWAWVGYRLPTQEDE